jgi:predicted enzyme related to lactoylglutathione lyase
MLQRDGYLPGVPCWVDTAQPDPDAAAAFYGGLFGWEFEDRMPPGSPGRYLMARLHGLDVAAVGSQPSSVPASAAWNTYIWVDSAEEAAANVRSAGGTVFVEPFDVLDAGRMGVFADPTGAAFSVWQPKEHKGAQLVNAPGTWNWSNLNTRDPDEAVAFYQPVFGWVADSVDLGFGESIMVRVPGYGDFLAGSEPDLRRRQADAGVPLGFEDAVAWILRMPDDDNLPEQVPAHWSVTFAVDDTDATVERASQLGGHIVVPPYDAGPVRVATLRDPYGAVFTVSRYQPG